MVASWCHVDILQILRRLAVENFAEEKSDGSTKADFVMVKPTIVLLVESIQIGGVVCQHLAPGSFVTPRKQVLKFGESLLPGPIQIGSCVHKIREGFLIKEFQPKQATINVDFRLSSLP
jgi:hypothetical protein